MLNSQWIKIREAIPTMNEEEFTELVNHLTLSVPNMQTLVLQMMHRELLAIIELIKCCTGVYARFETLDAIYTSELAKRENTTQNIGWIQDTETLVNKYVK